MSLEATLEREAPALLKVALARAKAGEIPALKLLLERALAKERLVKLSIPPIETADDVPRALAAVVAAVAKGELTAGEGANVAALIGNVRQSIETVQIAERLALLEHKLGSNLP